jgi:hypothetical protein
MSDKNISDNDILIILPLFVTCKSIEPLKEHPVLSIAIDWQVGSRSLFIAGWLFRYWVMYFFKQSQISDISTIYS